MQLKLICGTVEQNLPLSGHQVTFLDPPDNIGLRYNEYKDKLITKDYLSWLKTVLQLSMQSTPIIWCSFNSLWIFELGKIVTEILTPDWEAKACVQTFTFGQHNQNDLGNNHRPLWRLKKKTTPLYPDAIRIPSWRQLHGDNRADPRGRVPGDVFDFPRVTGNSKQRRRWHKTQLNEKLVERCLKLTCQEGDSVVDLYSGTGTTLRVCKKLGFSCTSIELDPFYCERIAEENGLKLIENNIWVLTI